MTRHPDGESDTHVCLGTGAVRRPMTHPERRGAVPPFPWSDLPLTPLNGLLAAVPIVVLAGLPLYVGLWLARVSEPERWVGLVLVSAFAYGTAAALYATLGGFLRARARVDDDLLDDVVEDRIVHVADAVEVVCDSAGHLPAAGERRRPERRRELGRERGPGRGRDRRRG